jgi:hypothetical protein
MARGTLDPIQRISELARKTRGEVDFHRFLQEFPPLSDDALAELIEQDGRLRLARGKSVSLERYIDAVPDLFDRQDPLDAAIDVTLRSLSRSSRPDDEAVDQLISRYPQIAELIEEAAALNNALWSTTGLRRRMTAGTTRTLPEDFGPQISGSETGESRYVLQNLLGSGAYGQVFLAVDRQLSDDDHPALVAVKILAVEERNSAARRQLAEEATKARRIDHPNVVRVLDRGVSGENEDYIVYEFVDGGDLGAWLRDHDHRLPVRIAVKLATQIARGVQAAHAAGLVHCDLKPNNIMLKHEHESQPGVPLHEDRLPTPKVADFGIAIRSGESLSALQGASEASGASGGPGDDERRHPLGNLAYISPEQFRMDDGALTVPSDVYALGGMLFTFLTGELPNGATVDEVSMTHHPEHGRTEPPRVKPLRPEVDDDLEAICRRAMATRPEDRYSAAGAMADDLEAWLAHEPIYWTRPSLGRLVQLWVRRRPALAGLLLGIVVLSILGAAVAGHYAIKAQQATIEAHEATIRAHEAKMQAMEADQQRVIEQMRADEEARLAADRVQTMQRLAELLHRQAEVSDTLTQTLTQTWAMHHMLEAITTQVPEGTPQLEDIRFRLVERQIEQLRNAGHEQTFETRLWQMNLAFWLIARGDVDRAEPLMQELDEAWRAMLQPDDPWLNHLDAMQAALNVRRFLARTPIAAIDPANPPVELVNAVARLDAHERHLNVTDAGNPMHKLMLEAMLDAYGPALLDDAASHQRVTTAYRDLTARDGARRAIRPRNR